MRRVLLCTLIVLFGNLAFSRADYNQTKLDELLNSFRFEHSGTVILRNGIGKIIIPQGYKYLDPGQAETVLTELWGNPKTDDMTLGMLLPENQSLSDPNGFVFNIQYDEVGYVKDDNAWKIDYNKVMQELKKQAAEENEKRINAGFEPVAVIGWAFQPYYDQNLKVLHWAKELKYGDREDHMLNYNIRILGRKGVMVLNAMAPMSDLHLVQADLNKVITSVRFTDNYQYSSFNPQKDRIASGNIASLISGSIFRKIDFWRLFYQNWTLFLIIAIAFFRPAWEQLTALLRQEGKWSIPEL